MASNVNIEKVTNGFIVTVIDIDGVIPRKSCYQRIEDAFQAIYREFGGDGDGLGHYEHSIVIVDNQKDQDRSCDDTELIECAVCKKPLNRLSLWVTAEAEPRTLCEECHQKEPSE